MDLQHAVRMSPDLPLLEDLYDKRPGTLVPKGRIVQQILASELTAKDRKAVFALDRQWRRRTGCNLERCNSKGRGVHTYPTEEHLHSFSRSQNPRA